MPYVYSTLTAPNTYASHNPAVCGTNAPPRLDRSVTIAGGANTTNRNFITRKGVVTKVSDADADFLAKNPVFKRHLAGGFVTIEAKKADSKSVAKNLTESDTSAPMTPKSDGVRRKKDSAKAAAKSKNTISSGDIL